MVMPRYLFKASYTAEGLKGVLKKGGTSRRDVVRKTAESVGGSLESFYFAFGDTDVYAVMDLPDSAAAAAISLEVSAAGLARVSTVPLITPEEMDEAARRNVEYAPPGS
jgi:uncharacterized protein with GYD domain